MQAVKTFGVFLFKVWLAIAVIHGLSTLLGKPLGGWIWNPLGQLFGKNVPSTATSAAAATGAGVSQ